ncbi:hypothetical protein [Phenylobacterium sp.]|uniref:hypothetical protein n=1 Tax=Phenylobacterium sp. TaxID=1871053 RepID=UPI002F3E6CAD
MSKKSMNAAHDHAAQRVRGDVEHWRAADARYALEFRVLEFGEAGAQRRIGRAEADVSELKPATHDVCDVTRFSIGAVVDVTPRSSGGSRRRGWVSVSELVESACSA